MSTGTSETSIPIVLPAVVLPAVVLPAVSDPVREWRPRTHRIKRFTEPAFPNSAASVISPVYRRLAAIAPLSAAEIHFIQEMEACRRSFTPAASVSHNGRNGQKLALILSGWACHQRILPSGRRQIFGFILPGDILSVRQSRDDIVALTHLVLTDSDKLLETTAELTPFPVLAKAVLQAAQEHEARLLDHVVRLGSQAAYQKVAHLMLELRSRLALVGLADETSFHMPLTQEVLADALGLSTVHVNRTLQHLRREKMIDVLGGEVVLLDPARLAAISDYAA